MPQDKEKPLRRKIFTGEVTATTTVKLWADFDFKYRLQTKMKTEAAILLAKAKRIRIGNWLWLDPVVNGEEVVLKLEFKSINNPKGDIKTILYGKDES